jgi:glycerate kinase
MKILIAPDSFKESLSAEQVAKAIKAGFITHYPNADYHLIPIADGGEGTLDALVSNAQGEIKTSLVQGPLGDNVMARWGLIKQGACAVIEMAEASGIALTPANKRQVLSASSFGTGEIILEALNLGVKQIILCLGGSATNDAGAGIAQALGVKLLNKSGIELLKGGAALSQLTHIDLSSLHPRASEVEWLLACDVDNPLCGQQGASAVFGPQKGATPEQVKTLDLALAHFAQQAVTVIHKDHTHTPGFGAAGGTALGIALFTNPKLTPGIEIVLQTSEFEHHLTGVDLVITGEGQMDYQTLHGKAPFGVAKAAKEKGISVIAISGSIGSDTRGLECYFDAIFGTTRAPLALEKVLEEAEANVTRVASNVAATLKLSLKKQA